MAIIYAMPLVEKTKKSGGAYKNYKSVDYIGECDRLML